MNIKLQTVLLILIISTCFLCTTSNTGKASMILINKNCCVDTFKLKYQVLSYGNKIKKVDENIYVGILNEKTLIKDKIYKKFIFGESLNRIIAFVRQDEEKLSFIKVLGRDTSEENTLLFFNKKIGDKWNVQIEDSYFWRKDVTFTGIEYIKNELVYVYIIENETGYVSLGDNLSKVYYSKEKGFLKFFFRTHWITVEVDKVE